MTRTATDGRRWAALGTGLVRAALAGIGTGEAGFEAPSALPGWTRKHLLAHVAANADALRNLATWARTGVETPMYASAGQRNADIEAGAVRPAADLLAWFDGSAAGLESDWAALTDEQWDAPVVTAQGRTVAASETPWLRAREAMVHAVDFDSGVGFADLPPDFCAALVADIVVKRSAGGNPALVIAPTDHPEQWQVAGEGEPVAVSGPLAELTAWLAGRSHQGLTTAGGGALPPLPTWL